MNEIIDGVNLAAGTSFGNDIVNMVITSGPVSKIVLMVLVLFSLGSWGVMLDKWILFRKSKAYNEQFLKLFRKAKTIDEVVSALKKTKPSSLARIFIAAYKALRQNISVNGEDQNRSRRFELALDDAILVETQFLEKRISFLGTCGGVTPFIGLFGTVWGIMNSFHSIGMIGAASIAAVAPGISEALIATAAGLAAAVPAVIGYNLFLSELREFSVLFERFRTNMMTFID